MKERMKEFREFAQAKATRVMIIAPAAMTAMMAMANAEEPAGSSSTSGIMSAFSTGFQGIVSDGLTMISAMVPIALSLAGVIFLVKKAMGWFKGMTK